MWPYPWTHVGTPSHPGHMDRVAATMPSPAHAGAAQEAPDIGHSEGRDVPLVRPSSCTVKGGIPSSRRYLPTYLSALLYPAHHPHPTQLRPPEGWAFLREAHLAALDVATATRMGLTDQRAYVRSLQARLREAHRLHTRSPSPPQGQGGSPAPDTYQAKKTKTGQGACQRARQRGATPRPGPGSSHTAPAHAQTPGAHHSTAPTSAHHHHRTAALKPCSPVSHHRPHTFTPCQDHHTRRARGDGTTNTTTTPPSLPTPGP